MPETYQSRHTGSIADLIRQRGSVGARAAQQQGDLAAQRAAASGQAWGGAIQNIGQAVSGTLADFAKQRADAPMMQLRQRQADQLAAELSQMEAAQAAGQIGKLAQMVQASNYDPNTAEPIFRAIGKLSPDYEQPLMQALMDPQMLKSVTDTLISQTPGYKAPEGFSLSEGQTRFDPSGKPVASVAKPDPVAQPFTLGEGQVRYNPDGTQVAAGPPKPEPTVNLQADNVLLDGRPTKAVFNPRTGRYTRNGEDVTDRVQPIPPQGPAPEPLVAVMGPDGAPVLVPRSQAAGKRPASNREQGRAVTSGDAGELAEFTTALDDIATVSAALSGNKATGTMAKAGAMLPNAVTEAFGWGTEAKQKQAVIDRVKQVIGKALEGGVLRKEDELKYAKILPTIGDTPEVVTSKLQGLDKAIKARIQRKIDALEDAGYDVQRFRQRTAAPVKTDPVDDLIKKYGGG